jgi:hypothetical protein
MSGPRDTRNAVAAASEGRDGANRPGTSWPRLESSPMVAGWLSFITYAVVVLIDCPPPFLGHDTEHVLNWVSTAFEYGSSPLDQSVISPEDSPVNGTSALVARRMSGS